VKVKGLKWGVPIGSLIMALTIGPAPYWSDNPPAFLADNNIASAFFFYGLMITAGIVAGVITRGSWRRNILAGALCAIPATVVYWLVLDVANIGDGIIAPVMLLFAAALGAIGGLIGYLVRRPQTRSQ
jgi:uncharacterized membrane protein YdjX (TVP38/TMEM64 family)